jgi:Ran GTPase-activating protein (RanGAP) involved in mRNA processing and transport
MSVEDDTPVSRNASASVTVQPGTRMQRSLTDQRAEESHESQLRAERAYVAWCNTFLSRRSLQLRSLSDLSDGVLLCNLLEEAFQGESLGRYNRAPRQLAHKMANVQEALNFMKAHGIEILSISSSDVVAGTLKYIVIVMWNLIRGLTLRGLLDGSGTSADESKHTSVRSTLLDWCQEQTSGFDIKDFGESFRSGEGFVHVVHSLLPEQIDVAGASSRTAAENLQLASEIAERELGIPSLVTPEDLEKGTVDEQSVMNYVCMLVSASKSKREALEREEQKREKEVGALKTQMEQEKKEHEEMESKLQQLQNLHEKLTDAGQQLQEELATTQEQREAERQEWAQQFQKLRDDLEQSHQKLNESRQTQQQMTETIASKDGELKEANASIYSMHLENEDLLRKLQNAQRQIQQLSITTRRHEISRRKSQRKVANDLNNALVNQSLSHLMSGMYERTGILMKKRPKNIVFSGFKTRHCVLKADALQWFEKADGAVPKGQLDLRQYELVAVPDNNTDEFELVPSAGTGARHVGFKSPAGPADARMWVRDINLRISMLTYVKKLEEDDLRGCREIVDFVGASDVVDEKTESDSKDADEAGTDNSSSKIQDTLRIENVVTNSVSAALQQFRTVLCERKNFRRVVIQNSGFGDDDMKVLADILADCKYVKELDLSNNKLTCSGAGFLADALKANKSITHVNISGNQIGDDGLSLLAAAIPQHGALATLCADDVNITDEGAVAFVQGIMKLEYTHADAVHFTKLQLANNQIGSKGAAFIAQLCEMDSHITELDLQNNSIDDAAVESIASALKSGKTGLRVLLLGDNHITSRGVASLSDAMKATASQGHLKIDLCGNKMVGRKGIAALMDADFALEFPLLQIVRASE